MAFRNDPFRTRYGKVFADPVTGLSPAVWRRAIDCFGAFLYLNRAGR